MTPRTEPKAPAGSRPDLKSVAAIIPALNEAQNLRKLLPTLNELRLGQIIVGDNNSTDATSEVAREHGASIGHAPKPGYGAACWAAMQEMKDSIGVLVFVNADLTDDVTLVDAITKPIRDDECDLVIGIRVPPLRAAGSMSLPQRFGDRLATRLIRMTWGYDYYDLGPFRAVRRSSIDLIDMQDRAFGWTVEMQIRAVQLGLRIQQLPVPYLRSPTPSKIGGTARGIARAAYGILSTWYRLRPG